MARRFPSVLTLAMGSLLALGIVQPAAAQPLDTDLDAQPLDASSQAESQASPSELALSPSTLTTHQGAGEVTSHPVTLSHQGDQAMDWQIRSEGSGLAWHQPQDAAFGSVVGYFGADVDGGTYNADDFVLTSPTTVTSLFTPGSWHSAFPRGLADVESLTWSIYPDAGGEPAGWPEEASDSSVWSLTLPPGHPGVHTDDDDLTLDLAEAELPLVELDAGHYWLVVFPEVEEFDNLNDAWSWHRAISEGGPAQFTDPHGLRFGGFYGGPHEWHDFTATPGPPGNGVAFTIFSETECAVPGSAGYEWLGLEPASGTLAPGESETLDVTLDATGLELGTYQATVCFGAAEDSAVAELEIELEVAAYGDVTGVVSDDAGEVVADAAVWAEGYDISVRTDQDGAYTVQVPAGPERTISAHAPGFAVASVTGEVEAGQTFELDFVLDSQDPVIGLLGDHDAQLAGVLDLYGVEHEAFTWGDDPSDYAALVMNSAPDPGARVFSEFQDATEHFRTGVVLLDSWGSAEGINGIDLLHRRTGIPEARGDASDAGELSYRILSDHPIVEGLGEVGDAIPFDRTSQSQDMAWFEGFGEVEAEVTLIADAHSDGERRGTGVAARESADGSVRHALLSMHAAVYRAGPQYWEPASELLFLNALEWAADRAVLDDPEIESIDIAPESLALYTGESAQLTATGHFSNRPPADVTDTVSWTSQDDSVAAVDAGEVTAISIGATQVEASWDGVTAEVDVAVDPVPAGLQVSPGRLEIPVEDAGAGQLSEEISLSNLGEVDIEWSVEAGSPAGSAAAPSADTVDGPSRDAIAGERFLTRSHSQEIVPGAAISCAELPALTFDNHYLRTFPLEDFGILTDFTVEEISFGVETLLAEHRVTVTVYELAEGASLTWNNLTEVGSESVLLQPQNLSMVSVPLSGTVSAGSTLVVDVFTPYTTGGNRLFIGANSAGQDAPSYWASEPCGYPEPVETTEVVQGMHVVMNVHGQATHPACADPAGTAWLEATPAAGTLGAFGSAVVDVQVDASDLAEGLHRSALCVSSTAGDLPVPVDVLVGEGPFLTGLTVEAPQQIVGIGETVPLTAWAQYLGEEAADVTGAAVWTSDAPEVIEVTDGLVTGLSAGTATITAAYEGQQASTQLTVEAVPAELLVDTSTLELSAPEDGAATASLTLENGGDESLEWVAATALPLQGLLTIDQSTPVAAAAAVTTSTGDGGTGEALEETLEVFQGDGAGEVNSPAEVGADQDGEVQLTQSHSLDVAEGGTTVCGYVPNTAVNHYLRAFTLADFGIDAPLQVTDVTFGIETMTVVEEIDVVLHQLETGQALTWQYLEEVGSASVELLPQGSTLVTVPVTGVIDADATLVVELIQPDLGEYFTGAQIFFGSNSAGQSGPTYWAAPGCGYSQPTDVADLGRAHEHLVMQVSGNVLAPSACTDPEEADWLTVDPSSGTIDGRGQSEIAVTAQATGLAPGVHEAVLCLSSTGGAAEVAVVLDVADDSEPVEESELVFEAPEVVMEGDTIVIEGSVSPGGGREVTLVEFIAPVPSADGTPEALLEEGQDFRFEVPAPVPGERHFEIRVAETDEATAVTSERFSVMVIEQIFSDVHLGEGFFEEIMWLAENGITTGYPDGTFRPRANITREAMAAFVYRYAGSPEVELPAESPFADVSPSEGFYTEMVWVYQEGISTGYADGTFRPRANISREAIAAFLYRAAGSPEVELPAQSPFIDIDESEGFYTEMIWMYQEGISTGYETPVGPEFRPRASLTREAMAAFMYRYDAAVGVESLAPEGS